MSILVRINRICAWILLVLMVIFIITGYAWHKHIIMNPRQAAQIHSTLDIILVFFFLVHAIISTRFALRRHGIQSRSVDLLLICIGLISYLAVLRVA